MLILATDFLHTINNLRCAVVYSQKISLIKNCIFMLITLTKQLKNILFINILIFYAHTSLSDIMKKLGVICLLFTVCVSALLCGCSNSSTAIAKDLSTAVSNFVNCVSSLDWPDETALDQMENIITKSVSDAELDETVTSSVGINQRAEEYLSYNFENYTADTIRQMAAAEEADQTTENSDTENIVEVDTSIDTSQIYVWLENLRSKINVMLAKRSDLLVYIDEIYSNNVSLSENNILAIKVYMNIIKDNSSYLTSYKGMLKNQVNEASQLYNQNKNTNIINAYLIKAVETLQSRCAKIDTAVLAMNSIIDILGNNLINNYFSYNIHTLPNTENNSNVGSSSKPIAPDTAQSEPTDNINTNNDTQTEIVDPGQLSQEDTTLPENDELEDDIALEESADNAINFESQTQQVESLEENLPQQADNAESITELQVASDNIDKKDNLSCDECNDDKNYCDDCTDIREKVNNCCKN